MDETRPVLKVGDEVKVRSGSATERVRWEKRSVVGTVTATDDLPAFGQGVKIQWPGEDPEPAFSHADQYDLVSDT